MTRHVSTAQEVPALGIRRVCFETFRQILDSEVLVLKRRTILMVEPSELLQHFGMATVVGDYSFVSVLCPDVVFLLFVNVSDLKPYVGMRERGRGVTENAVETGKGLVVFALLFVDYS